MAKVIYRGIKYDTTRTRSIQNLSEELTYRGIRHKKVAGVR
jgi:ribosomal protein S13